MEALKKYDQWVLWKGYPQADGSTKKIPYNFAGDAVNAHDTTQHMPYQTAVERSAELGMNVGFDVTENDPFFFIDVDDCVVDGQWTPNAAELINYFNGAALMMSQSGKGLHIVGTMQPWAEPRRVKPEDKSFDGFFTQKRFIATTGNHFAGDPEADLTQQAHWLISAKLPPKVNADVDWSDKSCEGYTCALSDEELIEKALSSKTIAGKFGQGVTFEQLWTADESLGERWPDYGGKGRDFDHTSVDAALAAHLCWWTGHDHERVRRLMDMSALKRDKWVERDGYMEETILGASANFNGFYDPEQFKEKKQAEITDKLGPYVNPYCDVLEQMELFKGHVYVHDCNMVFTPDGTMHNKSQYKAWFGGRVYALDRDGVKTTRDAFEALTESVDLRCPKVHSTVFLPKKEPATILYENGKSFVNKYIPPQVHVEPGDVSPFLNHVKDMIPNENDRKILLDYMAALVQKPGDKFQWCAVIQGTTGNGKTLLYDVLEYAVGKEYSHKVAASDIDNKFNAWIQNNILGCVEEIRMAGNRQKADFLKELITNKRVPIQGKSKDQTTGDNCINFIMFSNHRDAVLKTVDDRRYAIFYTAQQDVGHVKSDAHYKGLYDWLENEGLPKVAYYLYTRQITTNVFGRAPLTSSTAFAMRDSLGPSEQIIIDNIELGTSGFRGGVLSSNCITYALNASGRKVGPKTLPVILKDLGYYRFDAVFSIGSERFRLYVQPEHLNQTSASLKDYYIKINSNEA